jgi:4-amino-4-deoxy-L-arabinose transferase-like glycosyltransferase
MKIDRVLLIILFVGFSIRLVRLTEPLIGEQAWRQTDTAAIARNYYKEGYDFFSPRVDWRGETDGTVESEFPIYPFTVALFYTVLGGVHEWVGRLLSAVFSIVAAWFLYNLVKRLYDITTSRFATGFFVVSPLFVFYGRAFMPEAMMLACGIGALERFAAWSLDGNRRTLIWSAVLLAGAALIKPQMLHLGLPLLYLTIERYGKGFWTIPALWGYAAVVLLPTIGWYAYAHTLFERTHLTFGVWGVEGYDKLSNYHLLATWKFYGRLLERCWELIFTPVGVLLFAGGIVLTWKKPAWKKSDRDRPGENTLLLWLGAVLITILIIPEGNWTLNYYQLPLLPVGAIFVGRSLREIWWSEIWRRRVQSMKPKVRRRRWETQKLVLILLGLIIVGWSAYALTGFYTGRYGAQGFYEYTRAQHELGKELDGLLPGDALCVTADLDANARTPYRSQNPAMLYYLHRKGWQITPEEFKPERLEALTERGAKYFIAPRRMIEQDKEFSDYLLKNENYKKYKRRPANAQTWEFVIVQLR